MNKLIYVFAWIPSLLFSMSDDCACGDSSINSEWCDECTSFDRKLPSPTARVYKLQIKNDTQDNDPDARYICVRMTGDVANPPKKYFLPFKAETPQVDSILAGGVINYYIEVIRENFGNCISIGSFTYHVPKTISGNNIVYIRKAYGRDTVELWAHWLVLDPQSGSRYEHREKIGELDRDIW